MLETATLAPPASTGPAVYRPRRPAATLLHRTVREHLETYLASAGHDDDLAANVPFHVQAAFREYLKCGILAHGFARVYCAGCGHDFLVAFSCKGRDICPSCATRRMVETAAHMVDHVLPAGAVPPVGAVGAQAGPLAPAREAGGRSAVCCGCSCGRWRRRSASAAPARRADARFGAVAFVHRFGSYLNSHVHFHVLVTDGVFSAATTTAARVPSRHSSWTRPTSWPCRRRCATAACAGCTGTATSTARPSTPWTRPITPAAGRSTPR